MNEQENNNKEEVLSPKPEKANKNNAIGLDENIAGMICYFFIVGLIFLFVEKENRYIRFHALQSVFFRSSSYYIKYGLAFYPNNWVDVECLVAPAYPCTGHFLDVPGLQW